MTFKSAFAIAASMVVVTTFLPRPASAQGISLNVPDSAVRMVPRTDLPADRSIRTRNGEVALLLTDADVVMQLTDAGLEHVSRETGEKNPKEGVVARMVGAMVRAGVLEMLDRGVAFPLDRLKEARIEDRRLLLIDREGERVFADVTINDEKPMDGFSRADAERFAKKVNKAIRERRKLD